MSPGMGQLMALGSMLRHNQLSTVVLKYQPTQARLHLMLPRHSMTQVTMFAPLLWIHHLTVSLPGLLLLPQVKDSQVNVVRQSVLWWLTIIFVALFIHYIYTVLFLYPHRPTIHDHQQGQSWIYVSWRQQSAENVTEYEVKYSYVGHCGSISRSVTITRTHGNEPYYNITGPLEEYSNYSINVTAINGTGRSPPNTAPATTLPEGNHDIIRYWQWYIKVEQGCHDGQFH